MKKELRNSNRKTHEMGKMNKIIIKLKKNLPLIKAFSISVLNQIISSGSSFALSIYLVNVFNTEVFGTYGVIFVFSVLFSNLANSMFTIQMVAHFPQGDKSAQLSAAKKVLRLIISYYAISAAIVVSAHFVFSAINTDFESVSEYIYMVSAMALGFTIKEFFIRLAYSLRKEHYALLINSIILASLVIMVFTGHVIYDSVTMQGIIYIMAVANAVGAAAAYFLMRLQKAEIINFSLRRDFFQLWVNGGGWAALYSVAYNLRLQAYTLITAAFVGVVAVGLLNGSRLLIAPIIILSTAVSQIMVPRLVSKESVEEGSSLRYGVLIAAFQVLLVIVYVSVLILAYRLVVGVVLPEDFPDVRLLVGAWAIYAMVLAFRNGMEIVLVSQKKFKIQMKIAMMTLPISLLLVFISVNYALFLVVSALALTEIIHVSLILKHFHKYRNKRLKICQ